MPTGYTAPLYEGDDISLRDFVLRCSRAMGARVMERDNPSSDYQIRLSEPSTHHKDSLAKAKKRQTELLNMTSEEAAAKAESQYQRAIQDHEKSLTKDNGMRGRYEAMPVRVNAWIPPTEDHEGLKKFMIQQLTESIEHDCPADPGPYGQRPQRKTGEKWLIAQIKSADWDVAYHAKHWAEGQERTASRNKWLTDLDESLRGVYV